MAALATVEDLATYLQRDLSAEDTATAELVLDLVSAAIRSYTGQTITAATSPAERVRATNGKIRLRQRPVTAVTAVTTTATPPVAVTYEWDGFHTVYLTTLESVWTNWSGVVPAAYLVTYSHGYAAGSEYLEPARLAALRAAKSLMGDVDTRSETIGGYSVSYDDAKREVEKSSTMLDRYKAPVGPILMERL